jgi:hypothetical protein
MSKARSTYATYALAAEVVVEIKDAAAELDEPSAMLVVGAADPVHAFTTTKRPTTASRRRT